MISSRVIRPIAIFATLVALATAGAAERPSRSGDRSDVVAGSAYPLDVLPPEHRKMVDPVTGVELVLLTTAQASRNLYFHDRSWLADGSMVLFKNARNTPSRIVAYLPATGELVPIATPSGPIRSATAAARRNTIFGMRGNDLVEIVPAIEISADSMKRSRVTATERLIGTFPASGPPSVSMDDRHVAVGRLPSIWVMDVATGEVRELYRLPAEFERLQHVQFSRTNPNLLSFASGSDKHVAGTPERLYVVDIREGVARPAYRAAPGELVTHESWWVNDQILFCGGGVPEDTAGEISHVNLLDPFTGLVRVVGPGAWWPGGVTADIWRRNWWHAAGSDDGRWIAADTFHGDIVLFDGRTARPRLLTRGHRTYGGGEHPEVGWDRAGRQVVFATNMLDGGSRACIATIPDAWRVAADSLFAGPSAPRDPRDRPRSGTPRRNR